MFKWHCKAWLSKPACITLVLIPQKEIRSALTNTENLSHEHYWSYPQSIFFAGKAIRHSNINYLMPRIQRITLYLALWMATSVRVLQLRPCTTGHFMLTQLKRSIQGQSTAEWDIKVGSLSFWSTAASTILISLSLILQYLCVDTMLICGVSLWSVSRTTGFVTGAEGKISHRTEDELRIPRLHNLIHKLNLLNLKAAKYMFLLLIKTLSKFSVC